MQPGHSFLSLHPSQIPPLPHLASSPRSSAPLFPFQNLNICWGSVLLLFYYFRILNQVKHWSSWIQGVTFNYKILWLKNYSTQSSDKLFKILPKVNKKKKKQSSSFICTSDCRAWSGSLKCVLKTGSLWIYRPPPWCLAAHCKRASCKVKILWLHFDKSLIQNERVQSTATGTYR